MDPHKCQFCGHANPADSKYCSECGGCLYLVPCASCGAINDVKAVACYQCHGQLQAGMADGGNRSSPVTVIARPSGPDILSRALDVDKLDPAYSLAPATDAAQPFYRRHARTLAAAAAIAGVAVLGFYGYRYQTSLDKAPATAAGGDARATNAASAGTIRSGKETVNASPAKAAAPAAAATAAVSAAAPAAANDAPPAAMGAINLRGENTGKPATTEASKTCSDASAALGLCAPAAAAVAAPSAANAVPPVTHTLRKE